MKRNYVLVIILLLVVGSSLYYVTNIRSINHSPDAQAQAIKEAQEYKNPDSGACITVVAPAVHKASGARYTFSTPCDVPPGWKIEN